MFILSIILVSMIIITSQSQVAFGGAVCGPDDPDCDGIFTTDNCPNDYNPGQEDVNDDGIGDACISPSELIEDVIQAIEELIDDVAYDNLSEGQINSFISKLESAADKIDSGQINGAIGSLEASINQINAFINSGKITYDAGQALIVIIQMVIDVLRG
jgi:hypothetical protein